MTPEEPLDDDMFINVNFLAKGPIQKAGVKTAYDHSSFFRIGSTTGRCPAKCGAIEATTGYIFRTEGLGSSESEGAGPGVWRCRSRRRQSLTGNAASPNWVANLQTEQLQAMHCGQKPCTKCINIKSCGFCWWKMKSKFKASCSVR
jgi:hypothetical protein